MDTMDEINRQANALITQEVERRAKAWLQGAMGVDWKQAFEQIVKERDTLRRQLEAYQELLSAASRLMSVTSLRGEPEANLLKAIWKIEAIGKGGDE